MNLGYHEELYQKTKRRIVLAYMFLAFPSLAYSAFLGFFFLEEELTSLSSIGMAIIGLVIPCCSIISPPVMGICNKDLKNT